MSMTHLSDYALAGQFYKRVVVLINAFSGQHAKAELAKIFMSFARAELAKMSHARVF
jgi:hypothetical protein